MTAREIKDINREISRLRAKMARIRAEADNTAVTLGERIVPSGQTSDRVGNAVVQIADIQRDIQNLEIRRNSALNSLSRDDFVVPVYAPRLKIQLGEDCSRYRRNQYPRQHKNYVQPPPLVKVVRFFGFRVI